MEKSEEANVLLDMKGKRCDLLSAQLLQKVVEDILEPIEDPK